MIHTLQLHKALNTLLCCKPRTQDDAGNDGGEGGGDLIATVPDEPGSSRGGPPRGSAFGSVSLAMQPPQARALVASVRRMGVAIGAQMQRRRALSRPVMRRGD